MSNIQIKQGHTHQVDEIDLSGILDIISQNRWLILIVTLFVSAVGFFISSKQIPQYQSDVLIQIDSGHSNLGQSGGMGQQFVLRPPDVTATQVALIQSRFILEPVIKSLGLDISATPKKGSWWARMFGSRHKSIQVTSFVVPRNQINQSFNLVLDQPSHVSLYDSEGDLLLQGAIGSIMTNAQKTIRLQVNAIQAPVGTEFTLVKHSIAPIVKLMADKIQINQTGGRQASSPTGIMELSMIGPDPVKVVHILNTLAKTAKAQDAQKKSEEAAQTLAFLYQQVPITKGSLEEAEDNLNRYRAKSGKIDANIQTGVMLSQLTEIDKQLDTLSNNKIEMLQHYTLEHPSLIVLNKQLKILEAQRNKLEKELKTRPASDQIAINLMREVKLRKTLYLQLSSKIQELELVKAGTVSSVHILSFAQLPDAALPSKVTISHLVSVLVGLLASAIIIVIRKLTSPHINDPYWCEKHFNLANLAIIPYCDEQMKNMLTYKEAGSKQLLLLAHANPRNLSIESLRSLRTSLQVTLTCASNNIISILGVSPGVGKSFVSANLAYLLAAGGKRVLLIDCDLRRGTLHKYINVSPMPGMAEVINNVVPVDSALTKTLHKNLTFLPRGAYPKNPSELLISEHFKTLMSTFAEQYDVVVIDTAPLLLVTDAAIIGSISATNYLVMGASAHQPKEIEMVMKHLASSDVQVQGTIFNFHRRETVMRSYGQYGKYGKYSYYKNNYYYDESMKSYTQPDSDHRF